MDILLLIVTVFVVVVGGIVCYINDLKHKLEIRDDFIDTHVKQWNRETEEVDRLYKANRILREDIFKDPKIKDHVTKYVTENADLKKDNRELKEHAQAQKELIQSYYAHIKKCEVLLDSNDIAYNKLGK